MPQQTITKLLKTKETEILKDIGKQTELLKFSKKS